MLIVSLPPVYQGDLLKDIVTHPRVDAVRYNTGMTSPYEPRETVGRIQALARPLCKPVYIDLKAKQLRVTEWADLPDGPIVLNHRISVSFPAKACFRGDDCCEIKEVVDGTQLFVDPLPKFPVGRGQAVNVLTDDLRIEGGLLPLDHAYIKAGLEEGVAGFLLSFVESHADIKELEGSIAEKKAMLGITRPHTVVLKIESRRGVQFIRSTKRSLRGYRLMAARDDLMVQIGLHAMPDALRAIVERDPDAICASRLLLGLESGSVTLADLSDLEYMRHLGYGNFMLSDGISRDHFSESIRFWEEYANRG